LAINSIPDPPDPQKQDVSTDDLKDLQHTFDSGIMDEEAFSLLTFERLCQNGASFDVLMDFLRDSNRAIPGSGCFNAYLLHAQGNPVAQSHARDFVQVVQQSLVLGSILPSELTEILDNIKILVDGDGADDATNRLADIYLRIWNGLKACRVHTPDQASIFCLLQKVKVLNNAPAISSFKLELFHYCWPASTLHNSNTMELADYLVFWSRLAAQTEQAKEQHNMKGIHFEWKYLVDIVDAIARHESLDPIHVATAAIVRDRQGPHNWEKTLQTWLSTLRASTVFNSYMNSGPWLGYSSSNGFYYEMPKSWKKVYEILGHGARLPNIAEHFRSFGSRQICRLILRHWAPNFIGREYGRNQLKWQQDRLIRKHKLACARNSFEKHPVTARPANSLLDAGTSEYSNLLSALAKFGLPYQLTMKHVLPLLLRLHGQNAVFAVAETFQRSKVDEPRRSLRTITEILVVMAQDPSQNSSQGRFTFGAREILQYACRLNRPRIEASMDLADILDEMGSAIPSRLHCDLMHQLATAAASHPDISSRTALELVHVCYLHLSRRKSIFQQSFARALVHAAVTRPLSEARSISSQRFVWLLRIIQKVEGKEVANDIDRLAYEWRERVYQAHTKSTTRGSENSAGPAVGGGPAMNATSGETNLHVAENLRLRYHISPNSSRPIILLPKVVS
jgi:hypothetical protein